MSFVWGNCMQMRATRHAVFHLQDATGAWNHTWTSRFSRTQRALRRAFAHVSRFVCWTTVRARPWWGRRACRLTSHRWLRIVYCVMRVLFRPIVSLAVCAVGLSRSCRWTSWMWRSCAGVATRADKYCRSFENQLFNAFGFDCGHRALQLLLLWTSLHPTCQWPVPV